MLLKCSVRRLFLFHPDMTLESEATRDPQKFFRGLESKVTPSKQKKTKNRTGIATICFFLIYYLVNHVTTPQISLKTSSDPLVGNR